MWDRSPIGTGTRRPVAPASTVLLPPSPPLRVVPTRSAALIVLAPAQAYQRGRRTAACSCCWGLGRSCCGFGLSDQEKEEEVIAARGGARVAPVKGVVRRNCAMNGLVTVTYDLVEYPLYASETHTQKRESLSTHTSNTHTHLALGLAHTLAIALARRRHRGTHPLRTQPRGGRREVFSRALSLARAISHPPDISQRFGI